MPRITKVFPHSLGKEVATERIKTVITRERVRKANIVSDPRENWTSDNHLDYSMKVFGYAVDGDLTVNDQDVVVNLNLPVIAVMVKGMIEDQMAQQMAEFLA